jgi:sugar phosphate permease
MALITLGAFPYLLADPAWLWFVYLGPLIFIGAGLGLSMSPVQTTAIETAPSSQAGQASGLFSTMRYLGSILGSSVMAAVLSGATPPVTNFRVLYATLFVSACSATIAALRLPIWLDKSAR